MTVQRFIANNGFGTNMYLAWDEESKRAFFVDPGAPCEAAVKIIKEHELDLSCIILTHGHGDHTGGLKYLQEQFPDAKVIAGRHERRWLFERKTGFAGGIKADVEVNDGDTLDVGGMHLSFIECPGHTPGGISVLCEGVLFAGDTLFKNSVGRTDLPGGDWEALIATLKDKLFKLPDDTVVLPGHMDQTTIGWEKRYNPFV